MLKTQQQMLLPWCTLMVETAATLIWIHASAAHWSGPNLLNSSLGNVHCSIAWSLRSVLLIGKSERGKCAVWCETDRLVHRDGGTASRRVGSGAKALRKVCEVNLLVTLPRVAAGARTR